MYLRLAHWKLNFQWHFLLKCLLSLVHMRLLISIVALLSQLQKKLQITFTNHWAVCSKTNFGKTVSPSSCPYWRKKKSWGSKFIFDCGKSSTFKCSAKNQQNPPSANKDHVIWVKAPENDTVVRLFSSLCFSHFCNFLAALWCGSTVSNEREDIFLFIRNNDALYWHCVQCLQDTTHKYPSAILGMEPSKRWEAGYHITLFVSHWG